MEWKLNDWESTSIVEITLTERDEVIILLVYILLLKDCCKIEIK